MSKETHPYKRGNRWLTSMAGKELKVMAVADNYVMVRYLNSGTPFTKHVKQLPAFLRSVGAKQIK